MARMVPREWCSEEAVSWFFLSLLARKGFWPIMGLGEDKFVVLSKNELRPLSKILGQNLVQGRHRVDIAAYSDDKLVVGITISKIIPLCLRVSRDLAIEALKMILAPPEISLDSYRRLKQRGFDFASMNVAKAFKIAAAITVCERFKRVLMGRTPVLAVFLLDLGMDKGMVVRILEDLSEYVRRFANLYLRFSLYMFKPCEISATAPTCIAVQHVSGTELIESQSYPFVEVMGVGWIGCKKCRYVKLCSKYFNG